jgi:hypothetical protein
MKHERICIADLVEQRGERIDTRSRREQRRRVERQDGMTPTPKQNPGLRPDTPPEESRQ